MSFDLKQRQQEKLMSTKTQNLFTHKKIIQKWIDWASLFRSRMEKGGGPSERLKISKDFTIIFVKVKKEGKFAVDLDWTWF